VPFDPKNAEDLTARTNALNLSDTAFNARLAVGVRNKPQSGKTTWVVLDLASGRCTGHSVVELASADLPEAKLGVVLAIAATAATWSAAGTQAEFLGAVKTQKFFVTGEAPFWIRHLRTMLEVLAAFR
jgi:hypothetical protein